MHRWRLPLSCSGDGLRRRLRRSEHECEPLRHLWKCLSDRLVVHGRAVRLLGTTCLVRGHVCRYDVGSESLWRLRDRLRCERGVPAFELRRRVWIPHAMRRKLCRHRDEHAPLRRVQHALRRGTGVQRGQLRLPWRRNPLRHRVRRYSERPRELRCLPPGMRAERHLRGRLLPLRRVRCSLVLVGYRAELRDCVRRDRMPQRSAAKGKSPADGGRRVRRAR